MSNARASYCRRVAERAGVFGSGVGAAVVGPKDMRLSLAPCHASKRRHTHRTHTPHTHTHLIHADGQRDEDEVKANDMKCQPRKLN